MCTYVCVCMHKKFSSNVVFCIFFFIFRLLLSHSFYCGEMSLNSDMNIPPWSPSFFKCLKCMLSFLIQLVNENAEESLALDRALQSHV